MADATPLSPARIAADLRRLGVVDGDLLMVHASLRAIGGVIGGAAGVITALDQAVGETGTLLMVLGARNDWDHVNELPPADRAAALIGAEPFDAATTPADPDVGVLAEEMRRHPGTLVSDHPEGRFAARGRLAEALASDPPWHDYFGPGSALERFVDEEGRVLRLGADQDTTTVLHYAEYLADVPGKRRVRRHRLVATPRGPQVRVVESLDDEEGIADYPGEDYFAVILREYLATGRARTGTVGNAPSELIDAAELVALGAEWMSRHLGGA